MSQSESSQSDKDQRAFIATMAREYGPEAGEAVAAFLSTRSAGEACIKCDATAHNHSPCGFRFCPYATATPSATEQSFALAERCWPAVRSWLNNAERLVLNPPKPEYKAILEADADRARKLLDDIEALVGRPVEPHRSGGPTS